MFSIETVVFETVTRYVQVQNKSFHNEMLDFTSI